MRRIANGGVPGWDVMRDHCHLQPRYMSDEAQALLELAAGLTGAAKPQLGPNPFRADEVVGWMLDGLATVQSQVRDARARRYQRGISYFVEYWGRAAPAVMTARAGEFTSGTAFTGLPPSQRAAVLASIADGLWWTGLRNEALALNAQVRSAGGAESAPAQPVASADAPAAAPPPVPRWTDRDASEANAWLQLGLMRISDGDVRGAVEALSRAHAIAPERVDTRVLLEHVTDAGG
jgi:hypothetical protein